jgi:hypothetical protein
VSDVGQGRQLGRAGRTAAAGRRRAEPAAALQPLGRPVTAMGRHVVCIASGLLLETIGNEWRVKSDSEIACTDHSLK